MTWLWQIAAKKAAITAVQAVIAILGSKAVLDVLGAYGITITIDPTVAAAGLIALLEALRNYLKNKVGIKIL